MSFRILILILAALAMAGCARSDRPPYPEDEFEDEVRPVSESWNVVYSVTESASRDSGSRPRLHMDAGYMASYENDSTYTLLMAAESGGDGRVGAVIFDVDQGDTSAVIEAQRIVYMDEDRRFEASGDVVVDGREERRMWSERLFWDESTQRIWAPGFVRIVTPSERIEGYNLDADEDLDNYSLERVTGDADIEEDDEGSS